MINNNWVFGQGCGINFSNSTPTPLSGFSINQAEGCSSISDINGNLLFYTDGRSIWDSNNNNLNIVLEGSLSSTQSVVIVPDPKNINEYYILTTGGEHTGPNNYINGGRLNVISWKFTPLSSITTIPSISGFSPTEKLIAIQHRNCNDFWIITALQVSNGNNWNGPGIFRLFLIDCSGFSFIRDIQMNSDVADVGYMKASPNAEKLAVMNSTYNNRTLLIYNFDNSTGSINNTSFLNLTVNRPQCYGLEFSPNSQILYYCQAANIFQLDLNNPTISPPSANSQRIYAFDGMIGALQLANDGNIYIARSQKTTLGAITNPNVIGLGCDLVPSFIQLNGNSLCKYGLPNLIPNFCFEKNSRGPKAIASFINPKRVENINNVEVSVLCLDNDLLVNGSDSKCETGYFVGLSEFNIYTWTEITPLYSDWVSPTSQAPNNIKITDFLPQGYQLRPNKIYKFRLAVGTPWDSTDIFFKVDCCTSDPILNEEIEQVRKDIPKKINKK